MLLRTSVNSPFGRKVRVTADYLGLSPRIERVDANFRDPDDPLRRDNPLGKMPVLICDDGMALYDSRVIVDYLNALGDGSLCPASGIERWRVLQTQALADGIMDAGVALVMEEVLRPEPFRYAEWQDFQRGKLERGINRVAELTAGQPVVDHGTIAIACMLEWTTFRALIDWPTRRPSLATWLAAFNERVPMFRQSGPQ